MKCIHVRLLGNFLIGAPNPDHRSLGKDGVSSEESPCFSLSSFPGEGSVLQQKVRSESFRLGWRKILLAVQGRCQLGSHFKDVVISRTLLVWVVQLLQAPWKQVAKKRQLGENPTGSGNSLKFFYEIFLLLFWNIHGVWSLLCCGNKRKGNTFPQGQTWW